jgi:DNA-binding transcriptional MerR regulator
MAYTVKQVAAMSRVSVRTLHFYDETGLLKPAFYGANAYRYYEESQLLMLQQILFYRELGFELKQIKAIIGRKGFEKVRALQSHRKVLENNITKTRRLIETIDKTIQHLKGKGKMKDQEMFVGFTVGAGSDRFNKGFKHGGATSDCKVSAKDTNGAMCVFDFCGGGGGPKHLHHEQDEWIYIIDGEIEILVGQKKLRLREGESIFIPRQVAHVWGAAGKPAKIVNVYQPAGKMEEFFEQVGSFKNLPTHEQVVNRTYTEEQKLGLVKIFEAHGMDLLGPPHLVE